MRDMVSCFGEYAIQVSDASCSSYSGGGGGSQSSSTSCISPSPNSIPSVQNEVTCVYRVILSTQKHLTITATWTNNNNNNNVNIQPPGLSLTFAHDYSNASFKFNTISSRLLKKKKKGNKSFQFDQSEINVFWDFSSAKYDNNKNLGPEPINGFYVLIMVDSELGLSLGDMMILSTEEAEIMKNIRRVAKCWLISRREGFWGKSVCVRSKAQFRENGSVHEVWIRFSREKDGTSTLLVSIDRKNMIRVKRLQWNFRGNQTIFVDGLFVDLMWDVHGCFFDPENGAGIFMFRTRSGLDDTSSRLWMQEEKLVHKEKDNLHEFSLVIYAAAAGGGGNRRH